MELNFDEMERKAKENQAESERVFNESLTKETERARLQRDRLNSTFEKMIAKSEEEHEREMLAEIEKAQREVENDIREKYRRQYGIKAYNENDTDKSMRGVASSLITGESHTQVI